tara:strand:- start:53709 stop:53933 length:225 start_codon:yes stop_codon:yes gene_type:complete
MYSYFLSSVAKEDLRRIYYYGTVKFGVTQADKYFNMMHDCFDKWKQTFIYFHRQTLSRKIYDTVFVEQIKSSIK